VLYGGGAGGAINFKTGADTRMSITECKFETINNAEYDGGALSISHIVALNIASSIFKGLTSSCYGTAYIYSIGE
jgi:hypothetical protein